jgi:hypothetical protein
MNNNRIHSEDRDLLEQTAKVLPDLKALVSSLDSSRGGEEALVIFLKSSKRCLAAMENKEDKFRLKVKISF